MRVQICTVVAPESGDFVDQTCAGRLTSEQSPKRRTFSEAVAEVAPQEHLDSLLRRST